MRIVLVLWGIEYPDYLISLLSKRPNDIMK